MVSGTIGVGLIGFGLGGRAFHAPYVGVTDGMALRCVVSRDAGKVHADIPDVQVAPDVETMLARTDIDLVIVSSPDALHADHAIMALASGRHVLVDKPFAASLSDARRIARAGEGLPQVLAVFHNRRWDADFLTLRALLAEDRLGRVVELESRFDRWRPAAADSWKDAREGGAWLDLGPHLVDQALALFGLPLAVSADMTMLRVGAAAPDYFHVTLRYPDKRVVLHSSKLAADHRLRFAAHGTGGSWIKHGIDPQEAATVAGRSPCGDDWGLDPTNGLLTIAGAPPVEFPNRRGDYRLFWRALASAIRGEGHNPVPVHEALAVMTVLDAGLRSAKQRTVIDL